MSDDYSYTRTSPDADANMPLPIWNQLAKVSYLLALISPLAVILMAVGYMDSPKPGRIDSGWWITSWMVGAAAPIAVLLGLVSLAWRRYSPQPTRGYVYTRAGIIVGLLASTLGYHEMQLIIEQGRGFRRFAGQCASVLKQLSTATLMYSQDWDERLPLSKSWNEGIKPYHKNAQLLLCPDEDNDALPSYAMNRHLSGKLTTEVEAPEETVLFFDSIPGKNRAGGQELLPDPPRHSERHTFSFLDSHVKPFTAEEAAALKWKPQLKAKRGKSR